MFQSFKAFVTRLFNRRKLPDERFLETFGDRSSYSVEDWDKLAEGICPNCKETEGIILFARGGAAENVMCQSCKAKYWTSPIREMGAKRIEW